MIEVCLRAKAEARVVHSFVGLRPNADDLRMCAADGGPVRRGVGATGWCGSNRLGSDRFRDGEDRCGGLGTEGCREGPGMAAAMGFGMAAAKGFGMAAAMRFGVAAAMGFGMAAATGFGITPWQRRE